MKSLYVLRYPHKYYTRIVPDLRTPKTFIFVCNACKHKTRTYSGLVSHLKRRHGFKPVQALSPVRLQKMLSVRKHNIAERKRLQLEKENLKKEKLRVKEVERCNRERHILLKAAEKKKLDAVKVAEEKRLSAFAVAEEKRLKEFQEHERIVRLESMAVAEELKEKNIIKEAEVIVAKSLGDGSEQMKKDFPVWYANKILEAAKKIREGKTF